MDNPLMQLLLGSPTPARVLPADAGLCARYEAWLRDNHRWLQPALDTVRSLTLFLPGRFQEGGSLTSEAIYSALNVISVAHDRLLDQPRAVTAEISHPPGYAYLQVCQGALLVAHYTEVLLELAAKKHFASPCGVAGEQSRGSWLCLAGVEAIKAYCRLSMLYANRGRMLTSPGSEEQTLALMASIRSKQKTDIQQRERALYDQQVAQRKLELTASSVSASQPLLTDGSSSSVAAASVAVVETALAPLNLDALPPHSSFAPFALSAGHLPPVQVQNLIDLYVEHGRQTSPESKLGRPHGRFVAPTPHEHDSPDYRPPVQHIVSEILHIVRPVVYTLAQAEHAHAADSWTPIILSIAVDAASRALAPRLSTLSRREMEEVSSRIRGYFFYLLRDPIFTNGPLAKFAGLLARLPLIGVFFSSIINIIFAIQKYYFYTSAS